MREDSAGKERRDENSEGEMERKQITRRDQTGDELA